MCLKHLCTFIQHRHPVIVINTMDDAAVTPAMQETHGDAFHLVG